MESPTTAAKRAELVARIHALDPEGRDVVLAAILEPNIYNTTQALIALYSEMARRLDEMDEELDAVRDRLDDVESWHLPDD